jgi:V/A-type H+-transporting ATPase subunit A
MLKIIVDFHSLAERVVSKGAPIFKVTQLPIIEEIVRMKTSVANDKVNLLDDLETRMNQHFEMLEASLR